MGGDARSHCPGTNDAGFHTPDDTGQTRPLSEPKNRQGQAKNPPSPSRKQTQSPYALEADDFRRRTKAKTPAPSAIIEPGSGATTIAMSTGFTKYPLATTEEL
jgi:hypothetical protein